VKTALIVDDSRLARAVLGRVLAEHGIKADEVESAEAALEYLKERRPDVVFLDHAMPGMDGLEALEAIKANPMTATIPVMMYTSQEGQLYVGQARALGAIGVLPKSLQPVEIVKLLRRLRLIRDDRPQRTHAEHPSGLSTSAAAEDTRRTRVLIEALFYEQANAMREEIRKEFQRAIALLAPEPPAPARSGGFGRYVLAFLMLGLTLASGHVVLKANTVIEGAERRSDAIAAPASSLKSGSLQLVSSAGERVARDSELLELLEWAANRGNGFAFDTAPLDDDRAESLTALVGHLKRLQFRGRVLLDVHVGSFCMNLDSEGRFALAPPEQPASLCEYIGAPESAAVATAASQSLAFANAVAYAARDARIDVETISVGIARPAFAYPASVYGMTAGEWNAAAAANQRVEVRLLPAESIAESRIVAARAARP
jgi:CheY-like chemotaxis protein